MPIKLVSKSYTDIYGNSSSNYKANAGDKIISKLTISSDIYVRSDNQNSMSFDKVDGILKQSQGDFLELGFRKGMTIYWKDINNSNVVTSSWSATIDDVYPLYIVISGGSLPNVNNSSSQGSIWFLYSNSTSLSNSNSFKLKAKDCLSPLLSVMVINSFFIIDLGSCY